MKNNKNKTRQLKAAFIWGAVLIVTGAPIFLSLNSPLLAWREPIYIGAGLAGVLALVLLFVQPLLAIGKLPNLPLLKSRALHKYAGALLALMVGLHVVGLYITSPPDVIDVLLFNSPTPFSIWGVLAMWAVFASALMAAFRAKFRKIFSVSPRIWRNAHIVLGILIVVGSVVHAMLIEGTMESVSKSVLCVAVLGATVKLVFEMWVNRG